MAGAPASPHRPRFRIIGMGYDLKVFGSTLRFEDRETRFHFDAVTAETLPEYDDAFENALTIAVDEIAARDDVRADAANLSVVQGVQQLLCDHFETA